MLHPRPRVTESSVCCGFIQTVGLNELFSLLGVAIFQSFSSCRVSHKGFPNSNILITFLSSPFPSFLISCLTISTLPCLLNSTFPPSFPVLSLPSWKSSSSPVAWGRGLRYRGRWRSSRATCAGTASTGGSSTSGCANLRAPPSANATPASWSGATANWLLS